MKILQQGLNDCGLKRGFDISKIAKAKFQENLELLQWFKGYYDSYRMEKGKYEAKKKRNNQELIYGSQKNAPRGGRKLNEKNEKKEKERSSSLPKENLKSKNDG